MKKALFFTLFMMIIFLCSCSRFLVGISMETEESTSVIGVERRVKEAPSTTRQSTSCVIPVNAKNVNGYGDNWITFITEHGQMVRISVKRDKEGVPYISVGTINK